MQKLLKFVTANAQQVNAISNAITAYVSKTQANALHNTLALQDAAYAQNALQQFTQHKNLLKLFNALTMQDTSPREDVFYAIVNYCTAQKSATVNKFTFVYINALLNNFTLQHYVS